MKSKNSDRLVADSGLPVERGTRSWKRCLPILCLNFPKITKKLQNISSPGGGKGVRPGSANKNSFLNRNLFSFKMLSLKTYKKGTRPVNWIESFSWEKCTFPFQVVKDIELFAMVFALLLLDAFILLLQEGIDPVHVETYNVSTTVRVDSPQ